MKRIKLLAFILLFPSISYCSELKPFTTDGCSSFPEGTLEHKSLWIECCIQHDLAYWKGGSFEERLEADNSLEKCVSRVGEPKIAKIMLTGVRIGGSPYFPTAYRWGYGWPYPRGYKKLEKKEKIQVSNQLYMLKMLLESLSDELKINE